MYLGKVVTQLSPSEADKDTAVREQYLSDIQDIIRMFNLLKQKYVLTRSDEKYIDKTIRHLSELHHNIITRTYNLKVVEGSRGYIKAAYHLYTVISSRYSKKKNNKYATIWKSIIVLVVVGLAFILSGCDSKEDDTAELYTLNQLIKFECKSNGTGFTVVEDQVVGSIVIAKDVWYYPYTCSNGIRYSNILIKPVKVNL